MKTTHILASAAVMAGLAVSATAQTVLNEAYISHAGTDTFEFIEIKGTPGASLANHMVLIVEGDAGTQTGVLDRAYDLSAFSLDAAGFFVLGCPTVTPAPGLVLNAQDNFENGTETVYLLIATAPAATSALVGTNVTTGPTTTSIPSQGTVLDSFGFTDAGTGDVTYDGAVVFGPDGTFLPAGVVRCGGAPFGWSTQFLDFNYPGWGTAGYTTPSPSAANPICGGGPTPGIPFCFGDGSGTACPCANNSTVGANEGCLNSLGMGGKIVGTGTASISADTLVLNGTQMPSSSVLYFQGTNQAGAGAGTVFGDGLRCAGGTVIRLLTKTNVGGASQYPDPGDPLISVRGMCAVGDVRTYQAWYRNAAAFCTTATFNLTNGWQEMWAP